MVYSKNPDVIFRKIADEFILVPIRQKAVDLKSIYTLNEVAAFIWGLIDGNRDASKIKEKISEEFMADPSVVESDATAILSQLEALTFIRKT